MSDDRLDKLAAVTLTDIIDAEEWWIANASAYKQLIVAEIADGEEE